MKKDDETLSNAMGIPTSTRIEMAMILSTMIAAYDTKSAILEELSKLYSGKELAFIAYNFATVINKLDIMNNVVLN